MSVIVRLQNLPWAANAVDIRQYFHGLSIPEGGVHIVGGELGDAFIAFSTDEDARQAMLRDGGKIKEIKIRLFLSSRTEMQKIIDQARQQSLGMQQFMAMPTMPQMQVPVSNMTVPSMPVQNVAMQNMQNVPGMQVPMQNVQNVATMVSHMVAKPDDNNVVPPPAAPAPAIAVLPVQPEPVPAAPPSATSTTSVRGDPEKDKKDKRRRRTRSHSRDRSDSRSKSRSTSRSRSRSKDRKGRDRDRYYDRRRRRSRSRDHRRRRDRSRSRERSFRDKRRDFRHGSKEEADENSHQSGSNFRWGQRNQQSKNRPEFFNRQQQNRNSSFGPRGPHNTNNLRPPFPNTNDNNNQNKNLTPPPMNNSRLPAPSAPKDMNSPKQSPSLNIDSVPMPPTSVPMPDSKPSSNINTLSQSQNFFGGYPQNPPVFNPQEMVSYPTFNPSTAGSFNTGFNMPSPQQKHGNMNKVNVEKSEIPDKRMNIGDIKDPKQNPSQSFKHQTNSYLMKFNKDDSNSESIIPGISSEMPTDNIPLPDNSAMQKNNPAFGWGYGSGNYGYRNINSYEDFNKDENNSSSNYKEPFQQPDWDNSRESNRSSNKVQNTCVQIKSIPPRTTAEDIRAFFVNSNIPTGWLKIMGGDNNNGVAYVRFTSIHDKKQAILRSGCLLNNTIVTILHVDDSVYENAIDTKSDYVAPSGFWNLNSREQAMENKQLQQQKLEQQKQIQPPPGLMNKQQIPQLPTNQMIEQSHEEQSGNKNCIKIEGSVRFHPFFTHNHKMYPHIRIICDKYKLLDVCVTNAGGENINGFMKFDNSVNIDNVLMTVSNAKIEGRPVTITGCSEEEFNASKANCMPLDVQKFFERVRSHPKKGNFDSKNDKPPSKSGADFQVPRYKHDNDSPVEPNYNNDDDDNMEIEEELPNEPTRNKVLLPTPAGLMQQRPFEANPIPPTNCVLINNLPFQANDHDILDFFSDIGVIPTQIHIMLNANGKPSGDAFCEFDKHEEAAKAATKNKCQMGYYTIFVCLIPRQEMENALGLSLKAQGPKQTPFFNGPQGGPPMFPNARNNQPGGDWGPATFHPQVPPQFEESDEYDDSYDMPPGGRGGRGGRGRGSGRGFERGGRGKERGRGSSRGFTSGYRGGGNPDIRGRSSSIRGSGGMRGSDRGRGRGRGGREMREGSRPVPLMSFSAGPVMGSDAPVNLQEESVRDFGRPGCVVSAENVPFRATIDDILDFFRDFNLTPDCVIRRYDDIGKITGDARIAFDNPSEARRAVKFLNYKTLGTRKISLSLFK